MDIRNSNAVQTAEPGSGKATDLDPRIEEEDDDRAATLEHDEEVEEDDEVNRAAKNNLVRTNDPRG